MPNAIKVGSILFVTPVWNLGWSLDSSSLTVRFCLAATSDSRFFFLHNVSEFGASLSFLPLTYTAQLKTPASKPFIFIYSKFLYISSNEYKADFTAIQNVGAKSIFLACHFVPVTLLYILWWLALLFCLNHCLLFQSPSKPTTLCFQSHWLLGYFSKCICTFFNQSLNMWGLSWFGHTHQRHPSTPSLIHNQFSPMKIWTWSAFSSITGLQDENQTSLENQETGNISARTHCSDFRRNVRVLWLTVFALYVSSSKRIIVCVTHLS